MRTYVHTCWDYPRRLLTFLLLLAVAESTTPILAQFATVINAPPTVIGNNQSIGSDTQLNVSSGGSVGSKFSAGTSDGLSTNIEVNISGGIVGEEFTAFGGTTVNVTGGSIGRQFLIENGSTVRISDGILGGTIGSSLIARAGSVVDILGGVIGDNFSGSLNSNVTFRGGSFGAEIRAAVLAIHGGEFRLDGALIEGLGNIGDSVELDVPIGAVLNGTFADGRPFAFTTSDGDVAGYSSLTLNAAALPELGPSIISLPADPTPIGIRNGQSLMVAAAGMIPSNFNVNWASSVAITGGHIARNFEVVGSPVSISGGSVGADFDVFQSNITITGGTISTGFGAHKGSRVTISGGSVGTFFDAFDGSVIDIAGGSVGANFHARTGSVVNISGGTVSNSFEASSGAQVNITGGIVGSSFDATSGSEVNISGGSVGSNFEALAGSVVKIDGGRIGSSLRTYTGSQLRMVGGEFRLNGQLLEGLENAGDTLSVEFLYNRFLTGVFADGTPFVFSRLDGDSFANGTVTLEASMVPAVGPSVLNVPTDPAPNGLRSGQTMYVSAGGVVGENFAAERGTSIIMTGGEIGYNLEAVDADIQLSGGATIGDWFDAFEGTSVVVDGGAIGANFAAYTGTTVELISGSIGGSFVPKPGSIVNIHGGYVADYLQSSASEINITGGTIANHFRLFGGTVNILGGSIGDYMLAATSTELHISGGSIGDRFVAGNSARVEILGGVIGDYFQFAGQTLTITNGLFGDDGSASGTILITNGAFGDRLTISGGLSVHISGGTFGDDIEVWGSSKYISGGSFGGNFTVQSGSVEISGGSFGKHFRTPTSNSDVTFAGADFRLNGVPISGLNAPGDSVLFTFTGDSILSGTFADGTPFAFVIADGDFAYGSKKKSVTLKYAELAPLEHVQINVPSDAAPLGIRAGQTLTVETGGFVGQNFSAGRGSVVIVDGGQIGIGMEAVEATINLKEGIIDRGFHALPGTIVNIAGGTVGRYGKCRDCVMHVTGGSIEGGLIVQGANSELNLYGGAIPNGLSVISYATARLFGTQFVLDGQDITSQLSNNTPFVVGDRNVVLNGVLADGSQFSFDLNTNGSPGAYGQDFFSSVAAVELMLALPGDYNFDGLVDAADYTVWRDSLGQSTSRGSGADGNFDGEISELDYHAWSKNFGSTLYSQSAEGSQVPEPPAIFVIATLVIAAIGRFRRRLQPARPTSQSLGLHAPRAVHDALLHGAASHPRAKAQRFGFVRWGAI